MIKDSDGHEPCLNNLTSIAAIRIAIKHPLTISMPASFSPEDIKLIEWEHLNYISRL
jgi:hypothetical protein